MNRRLELHPVQAPSLGLPRVISPHSLDEALEVMATHGRKAKPLAGGTDLLVEFDRSGPADDLAQIEVLVDLSRIEGLDEITQVDQPDHANPGDEPGRPGRIRIGALTTHAACGASDLIRSMALPVAQACVEVGSPQLRNRATVAGNLVTASPANDTISPLVALDASLTLASTRGTRTVPLSEFHVGVRRTLLEPDELVTSIEFDALGPEWRAVFLKAGLRRAQAISVVHLAVACRFEPAPRDTLVEVRLALGSVAPTIVRCPAAESALVGNRLGDELIRTAARLATESVTPIDDVRASAAYRRRLVGEMVSRALEAVAAGDQAWAGAGSPIVLGAGRPSSAARGPGQTYDHRPGDPISATVNGEPVAGPARGHTLVEWLRQAGLTGTKEGCAEGECGACTVHLDGAAVLSCLVPDTRAHQATITTVEGLAADHGDLQAAFVEAGGVQCGYCIPGFMMSAAKLVDQARQAELSPGQLPEEYEAAITTALSGNLCRCTGYYKIVDALRAAITRSASTSPTGGTEGS